ncbi:MULTISPECIES: hypothetical protein [Halobacillus]|uniref:Uncharacterized protein n=1 Tax=Halobacillus halophilus (strain ATCC 35676 / DSM 2266 / JCM 20832 / KCTC 3685 / LMG 17431 / NBRC 102448 / NCIMB 2269) TaxID=866895 RepID=I0JT43_HALH3|nr:hypothetical protein [Halobacillus halophilus]CCG47315.1 hypothetical protein HBHAL_4978 [Halobacillus halophilus DSM 2266]
MLTSLYMLSLTVLLTFLVLYAVDKVANRFKKIQKEPAQAEEVPSEIDFSHSYK